jgi:hypothetical protein
MLVNVKAISSFLLTFVFKLVYFTRFGMLNQEKSGSPDVDTDEEEHLKNVPVKREKHFLKYKLYIGMYLVTVECKNRS